MTSQTGPGAVRARGPTRPRRANHARGFIAAALAACAFVAAFAVAAQAEMVTRRWGTPPGGPPGAKAKAPRAKPPTCYVPRTQSPPKLDGKLDDPTWKTAPTYPLARTLRGSTNVAQPTEVKLLRDDKTLYVAFRCTEALLGKLRAARRGHDGPVWQDDSVEVFLSPGGAYYQFGVNAVASTYDSRLKDASWNCGFRAAAGRERGAWTLEIAIPLAKMCGGGKPPVSWTANFNRNRYAAGAWQEMAWSPTYSGDSHVPGWFGKMLLKAPPAPKRGEKPKRPAAESKAVTIRPSPDGEGVVRFDLSALPKGTTIHRADLLIFRTTRVDGRMPEALTDIDVRPLFGKPAAASAKPLDLRGPWLDRLDATDAVRKWVAGTPNGGFLVKACPFWHAEATCLDVAYEGKASNVPPQVSGLRAFHRAGQTFLTWKEIDDPVGRDAIAWGRLKRIIDSLDEKHRVRYCVYRHDEPITADNLHRAELLAAVKPLSCWNVNARNIDRPIDAFITKSDVLMVGHWNPFRNASIDGEYGRDCEIDRLVIREGTGPLPRGTGLYVHTAARKGRACYAVVTCVDGVQNTQDLSPANSLSRPLAEAPAEAQPVLQGELPQGRFFHYDQKRLHYVRWAARGEANVPYRYHNWSVGVPNRLGTGVPLELSLHRDGHSFWRTQYRIERDSIVLCPYDFPVKSWWHGYHASLGTLKSFKAERIRPYTERRLLAFVRWACGKWPVDENRILVTGCRGGAAGSGALRLGLRHPDVFNLVICGHPVIDYASASRRTDRHHVAAALSMQAVWGQADWDAPADDGKSFWPRHNLVGFVRSLPASAELPYVTMTSHHGDAHSRAFYQAMLERHAGIMGEFSWGGTRYLPVSNTATFPNVIRLDIRKDKAYLAFVSAEGMQRVTEGKMGDLNRHFRWRDVSDSPARFEAALFTAGRGEAVADVALRRLQKFKLVKGRTYAWTHGAQRGQATVGDDGLLVIKGVRLGAEPARLSVTPK